MNGTLLARLFTDKFEDMIQSVDFTALFDMYRIVKVTYTFQLVTNPNSAYPLNSTVSSATVNPSNWYPKIWYIPDYDGGATETLNSIRERQGVKCRVMEPNKLIRISWTPKCKVLTYATDTTSGYAPRNIKIDMNDTAVPHYGLQCVFDPNGLDPDNTYPFKIVYDRKYTFKCYGVR